LKYCVYINISFKLRLHVNTSDFFLKKVEPILLFAIVIELFISEFNIRGHLLEHTYRELRGPPVLSNSVFTNTNK
jgi:hypothetical protein